jgi:hypothetical protein
MCQYPFTQNELESPQCSHTIQVAWNKAINFQEICKLINQTKMTTEFVDYHHRDLCYSYDRSNDSQRVTRKKFKKDVRLKQWYAVAYDEEVHPSHRFPCVEEIAQIVRTKRSQVRLNNRMYLVHDINVESKEEYLYIRYNHSTQVDLKKIQFDLIKISRIMLHQ